MSFLIVTIFSVILALIPHPSDSGAVLDQNCPSNEIYSPNAGPNQPSCWRRNETVLNYFQAPGCVCAPGMIRDPNTYQCIPEQNCPPPPKTSKTICLKNEKYSCENPFCETCEQLKKKCPVNIRCEDGCYCNEGYARNSNGTCIAKSECP